MAGIMYSTAGEPHTRITPHSSYATRANSCTWSLFLFHFSRSFSHSLSLSLARALARALVLSPLVRAESAVETLCCSASSVGAIKISVTPHAESASRDAPCVPAYEHTRGLCGAWPTGVEGHHVVGLPLTFSTATELAGSVAEDRKGKKWASLAIFWLFCSCGSRDVS